jgi:hypothetical protein
MSFLLEGKPRRRNRLPSRTVVPRVRTFAKDAANTGGGGQVQIQRPQRSQQRQQPRVIPQQQVVAKQQVLQKQDALQSAGISMEQGAWMARRFDFCVTMMAPSRSTMAQQSLRWYSALAVVVPFYS